jgi:hypothetical protein
MAATKAMTEAKAMAGTQAMAGTAHVVGVDFGTLSARAVVVRAVDGHELGTGVAIYQHGAIERALPGSDRPLPADWALQDPADWRAALGASVREALRDGNVDPASVVGIATDFTACTVLPVRRDGTPLCEIPGLRDRPHAWPKLWKHHAAQAQADRITALAADLGEPWLARYGGRISSEWQFAKALQLLEEDPDVYPPRLPVRTHRPATGRRARRGRARLDGRQPVGPRRSSPVRCDRRPDPGHHSRGHLPGAAGIDRVRHPHDRRGLRHGRRTGDLGVKWLLQRVWILEDWFHAWFTFDIARSCAN